MLINRRHSIRLATPSCQGGAVLLISLIALVLILLSTMALMRSMNTSLSMAGNLAFKRDLTNQGERGMARAIAMFTTSTGALYSKTARQSHLYSNNYSATQLGSSSHGIPLVLINDTAFSTLGMSAGDISDDTTGVTVRYVIDRLCGAVGEFDASACVSANVARTKGGSSSKLRMRTGNDQPVYRISVRVTGPRNTQAFFQSTITR